MLDRIEKISRGLSASLEWVGLIALFLMMVVTCADVIGAKVFLKPIFGAIDIVELSQLTGISFAAASTLLIGKHIQVEFFVLLFPEGLRAWVDAVVHLLGLLLFILIVRQLIVYGYSVQTGGEVSSTLRIPLYYFAYGAALGSIPVCLILFVEFLKSLVRGMNR